VAASMGKHQLPIERLKSVEKIRRQEKKSLARIASPQARGAAMAA
jgi:hypothetical protein